MNAKFHTAPNVVVKNADSLSPPSKQESALSITSDHAASNVNVNVVSPFVAAQQDLRAWKPLPKESTKLFIYTGNVMNVNVLPLSLMLDLGIGRATSAYWICVADAMFSDNGHR